MNQQFEYMNCEDQNEATIFSNQTSPAENLMALSPAELDNNMKSLAQQERQLLAEVLLTIREIDRRRLYLKFSYGSLFDYLTKHIGYSAGSAQRRIDAARIMAEVPDVKTQIVQGKINLTQISLMQRFIRQAKHSGKIVSQQQKRDLLSKLEVKTQSESEQLVAKVLDLPILERTIQRTQKDESVRLELTLSKEQFELLEKAKALVSHSVPSGDLAQVIAYLATRVIKRKLGTSTSTATVAVKTTEVQGDANAWGEREAGAKEESSAGERDLPPHLQPLPTKRRPISTKIKRMIYQRDKTCSHLDHQTGKLCGSSWQLELDHIQPLWAGGVNNLINLRLLCRQHNQARNDKLVQG